MLNVCINIAEVMC